MRVVQILGLSLLISGCAANPYHAFYEELPGADQVLARREAPAPKSPGIDRLSTVTPEEIVGIQRAGYAVIGHSSFNSGGNVSEQAAVAQAVAVGADRVVIVSPRYTETRTANIPITLPTSQTSYTTGSATAYGSGGPVTAYGSSTTTTYGTRTTMIPISVDRRDYEAAYLVKQKFVLGAYFAPLSDEDRARLGTNKGVRISLIVDNSPAFDSDLLVGDILLAINGTAISGGEALLDRLNESSGTNAELSIVRGDKSISKRVQLNPR